MNRLFGSMKIHHKIWLGFILILAVLVGISMLTLMRMAGVQSQVSEVIGSRQPTVFLTKTLTTELQQAASSLGFYLLSTDTRYKEQYLSSQTIVNDLLGKLKSLPNVQTDGHSIKLLEIIEEDINRLRGLEAELFEAAVSYEKNFPGIAYANANINPINRLMVQLTSQMMLSEMEEEPDQVRRELLGAIAELRYVWSNVMNGIRGYLAFRSDSVLQDMALYMDQANKLLGKIAAFDDELTLDQADALEQFRQAFSNYQEKHEQMLRIHGSDQWRTDTWLVKDQVGPLMGEIVTRLNELVEQQESGIRQTGEKLLNDSHATRNLVIALMLTGLLLGLAISWFISRMISRPLQQAAETMRDIASGQGDLTKRLQKHGDDEIGYLADSFNAFVGKIRELIDHTSHSTAAVISTVARTAENSDEITRRVLSQESDTAQVATAMNQMTATIAEVAANAANGEKAAQAAAVAARKGEEVVSATVSTIAELAGNVKSAEEVIEQVNRNSAEIGSVLDVIKAIAEQTNLLALNAAIEAARAGEQGRGFAVVADEVRNLANRTQSSTVEIESMIQRLQDGTHRAVTVMHDGRARAENNVAQSQMAMVSLQEINDSILTINQVNTQIATAASEQHQVAEEINRSISNINTSSSATAHSAQQNIAITDQLGKLASELQHVVMQFNIGNDKGLDFETAKSAHLAWRARIRAFLDGRASLTRKEAVSHHDCVLGKWYYGGGLNQYRKFQEMREIEQPHAKLHQLIREIIDLKEKGRMQDAEQRYREIAPLSEKIISLLESMESKIENAA